MKYKIFILLLVSIILSQSTLAEFQVSPSTINAELIVNQEYKFNISIKNNFNVSFYNIKLEPTTYITSTTIDQLESNQTKIIKITLLTSTPISTTLTPKLVGYFTTTLEYPPETHFVDIKREGYDPQNIEIRMKDSVSWKNVDETLSHTVTHLTDPIFDITISPNETAQFTFNNMGEIDYWDDTMLFHGYVSVTNNTYEEYTHNSDYDFQLTVNLHSQFTQTNILFELIDSDFTIDYNSVDEGLLRLKNDGNETAKNITLSSSSDWISFQENNFDIPENNQNYVQFLITPLVDSTNNTNITHQISLTAKGINTAEITKNINVFIPYYDIGEYVNYSDREELIKRINELRKILEELNLTEEQEKEIIYQEREYGYNYTGRELRKYLEDQAKVEEELKRVTGDVKPVLDYINNKLPELLEDIKDLVNATAQESHETKKRVEFRSFLEGMIMFIVLLVLLFGLIFYYRKKKKIMENKLI